MTCPGTNTRDRIQLLRVYEGAASEGPRILVERLWPRGIKKADLRVDAWVKEAAPSTELRKWFAHEPTRWPEFQRRYTGELEAHPEAWEPLLRALKRGPVTFLFSSRDLEHNNAVALKQFLERQAR